MFSVAVSWPANGCSAGHQDPGSVSSLAGMAVLDFSLNITQGNLFLNMPLWVLAVSFHYFLGHEFLACQGERS